jgi:hypothetical protein
MVADEAGEAVVSEGVEGRLATAVAVGPSETLEEDINGNDAAAARGGERPPVVESAAAVGGKRPIAVVPAAGTTAVPM